MNTDTRSSNSVKNGFSSILLYVITIFVGFLFQSVFLHTLGAEYNGIKGLFSNILSMLSIAELGFGSAIVFHLYKPIAEKKIEEIKVLINYYKKIYNIIAILILVLGIALLPIIPLIVGEVSVPDNIRFLFVLYLINTVFSYLLTYKRSILYADQKKYTINLVTSGVFLVKNFLQMVLLYKTLSFTIYLVTQIIFTILENLVINHIVNKKYTYLKDFKNVEEISEDLRKDIKQNVKGLLFHKIGSFIVLGTDNIIISITKGLGVIVVGVYSNYYMIIGQIKSLFGNVIMSLTASIGNLLIESDKEKTRDIYKMILLFNSWVFCFAGISIYCLVEPFITIWIGSQYLLANSVLVILCINLYVQGMRYTSSAFKEAGGIFYEDRFVPIVESIINIVVSYVLANIFGLAGVFIGTILSSLPLLLYSYPKYVYKKLLQGTYKEYFKLHLYHLFITSVIWVIVSKISNLIIIANPWLDLLYNLLICLVVPNILYMCIVLRRKEFKMLKDKILNLIKRKR